jgi:hypothetical protein
MAVLPAPVLPSSSILGDPINLSSASSDESTKHSNRNSSSASAEIRPILELLLRTMGLDNLVSKYSSEVEIYVMVGFQYCLQKADQRPLCKAEIGVIVFLGQR